MISDKNQSFMRNIANDILCILLIFLDIPETSRRGTYRQSRIIRAISEPETPNETVTGTAKSKNGLQGRAIGEDRTRQRTASRLPTLTGPGSGNALRASRSASRSLRAVSASPEKQTPQKRSETLQALSTAIPVLIASLAPGLPSPNL
jgi:hypothetical protein